MVGINRSTSIEYTSLVTMYFMEVLKVKRFMQTPGRTIIIILYGI